MIKGKSQSIHRDRIIVLIRCGIDDTPRQFVIDIIADQIIRSNAVIGNPTGDSASYGRRKTAVERIIDRMSTGTRNLRPAIIRMKLQWKNER